MAQIIARIIIDVDELSGSVALGGSAPGQEVLLAVPPTQTASPFSAEELRSAEEAGAVLLQLI